MSRRRARSSSTMMPWVGQAPLGVFRVSVLASGAVRDSIDYSRSRPSVGLTDPLYEPESRLRFHSLFDPQVGG